MADGTEPTANLPKRATGWFYYGKPGEETTPWTGRVLAPSAPIWDVAPDNREWIGTGRVWLVELDCFADGTHAPRGYFGGYWGRPGRSPAESLDLASATEAVRWGRARARQVLIRLRDDDTMYSAGDDNPDPAKCPEWPGEPTAYERLQTRGD
jgi:hypothetical protein